MFEIKPIFSVLLRQKTRSLLIIVQTAITLAIVSNTLHIIHERYGFMNEPSGTEENAVLSFSVTHFSAKENFRQQYSTDLDFLRSQPEVVEASLTNMIPFGNNSNSSSFFLQPSSAENKARTSISAGVFSATETVIQTFGAEMVDGRMFSENEIQWGGELETAIPVIVTQDFATRAYPESSALGKVIYGDNDIPLTIVGVVKKLRNAYLYKDFVDLSLFIPHIYLRSTQHYAIRTRPENMEALRNKVPNWMLSINDQRIVQDIHTIEEFRERYHHNDRAMIKILVVISSLLLVITALAIIGVTSFSISQRTKQIGTRRALGASRLNIVRYFLTENALLSCCGIAVGCAMAIALNSELMAQFNASSISALHLSVTTGGIILLSLLAVLFPALRASKISPAIATRTV